MSVLRYAHARPPFFASCEIEYERVFCGFFPTEQAPYMPHIPMQSTAAGAGFGTGAGFGALQEILWYLGFLESDMY